MDDKANNTITAAGKLQALLGEIPRKIYNNLLTNEPEVRSEFTKITKNFIDDTRLEVQVREEERIISGRPDARIGEFLIEFENPFVKKAIRQNVTDEKIKKSKDYIREHRTLGQVVRAVVTNGLEVVFIDEDENVVDKGDLSSPRVGLKFALWLMTLAPKAVTAEDMLDRFGSKSPMGRGFTLWCYNLYNDYCLTIPILGDTYDVWRGLYKEATNLDEKAKIAVQRFANNMGISTPNVERFLFSVETYLAVLMKLLVAEVSIQKGVISATSLRSLLGKDTIDGYCNLDKRIPFLRSCFEENVFDWFIEPTRVNKDISIIANMNLADMADTLDDLDFKNLRKDLIRELYQGFLILTPVELWENFIPRKMLLMKFLIL